jgi:flagellar basal-body rod modification protein FlgD
MDIPGLTSTLTAASAPTEPQDGFESLTSNEFFQLIITDLLNQDPLEPMDNDKLLQQLSSIREMEMSNQITTSLQSLTDQQRVGSATGLIGQYIASADGRVSGVVTGVRFAPGGSTVLQLGLGSEIPMDNVAQVTSLDQIRDHYQGNAVVAQVEVDGQTAEVRGTVTDVAVSGGQVIVHLDSGHAVPASRVTRVLG